MSKEVYLGIAHFVKQNSERLKAINMKPQYINRKIVPPEIIKCNEDELTENTLYYVRANFTPSQVFDLYDHDREVTQKFYNWFEASRWMDASIIREQKIGEWFINTDPNTPDKISFEQLWEIYCNQAENKQP